MYREGDKLPPLHPGEMLREEFLLPLELAPDTLAHAMSVPPEVVRAIVEERAPITGDIALRLHKALGASAEFWLNLQAHYELEVARDLTDPAGLEAIPNLNPQPAIAAE